MVTVFFVFVVNVNKLKAFEDSRREELRMERSALDANKKARDGAIGWHRPRLISDLTPVVATPGCNSTEKKAQQQREQGVLQALYFTKEM